MIALRGFFIWLTVVSALLLHAQDKQIDLLRSGVDVQQVEPSKEIVFGQTAFLSGHLGLYGNTIKRGIECYFKQVNSKGGIKGKRLRLISLDDEGKPEKSLENIKTLQKQGVTMFIGCTGTRSILAALPLIKSGEISMLFPWSGHKKFRDQQLKNMVNGLGFLTPQLESIVHEVVKKRSITNIAIFHADDDFSSEAAQELVALLKDYGVTPRATASYNRNTVDIKRSAQKLIAVDPKMVICLGTSMPTVHLIDNFIENGYYGTAFIGIDSTLFVNRILKRRGIPYTFSASVPDPFYSSLPLVQEYRINMDRYYPDETYNVLSLAYYLSAAIIGHALKKCQKSITPTALIQEIEKMHQYSIGGWQVTFDTSDRHVFGKNIVIVKG